MKTTRKFLGLAMVAAMFAVGCSSDDDSGDGGEQPQQNDVIVGKWRSPVPATILASFVDSIHVDFKNNQTYVVTSYKDGAPTELTGIYVTSDGVGNIRNIVLEQNTPTALTSEGIYRVEGTVLTYEVAQTAPEQAGVTPPTAAAGFGSTSAGAFLDWNIQTYYKMD